MTEPADADDADAGRTVHQNVFNGEGGPVESVIETVAVLTNADETELTEFYGCIDEMVQKLYETPPSPEAHAELTFSYEGFRITLYQDGHAVFQEI